MQGGMVWCSGWELASAVSNAGGLGLIGAGSMYPEILRKHIQKCKKATDKPFGVNIPLIYPEVEKLMEIIIDEQVKIVFTSAGNPKIWTQWLKERGVTVVHVIANVKFAQKSEAAGVDAIVAEGFEAGGHNGFDEITTLTLIPQVVKNVSIPVIAAGGIATGRGILAAFSLGAKGVQMGSRFVASVEASAHDHFKQMILQLDDTATELIMKKHIPVRLIKNSLYAKIKEAELQGASKEELKEILGKGKSKLGMFEGNLTEGELEIGQVSGLIDKILPVSDIFTELLSELKQAREDLNNLDFL